MTTSKDTFLVSSQLSILGGLTDATLYPRTKNEQQKVKISVKNFWS